MATNSRIGKNYSPISELTIAPVRMSTQKFENWVSAIDAARNIHFPRRRMLYELFDNIKIDGKVITVMQKRKVAITNKNFVFYKNGSEGTPVESIQTEVIDTTWFDEMLEMLEEEDFYGHTLLEFIPSGSGIGGVVQIPVANVVPETGLLLPNYMDTTNGIPFRGPNADKTFTRNLLEFGKTKNYGLLMSIAQYVIYKRGGFGDWAQFAELFGMPFRVGKYNPLDPTSRKLLNQALALAGGAGYAVIPEGTNLEFIKSNYGSGQSGIFKDLISECNDEIAQIALGGTMTTSDGSSNAQAKVHQTGEDAITASRLKKIIKFLNTRFKDKLVELGYKDAANGFFKVESLEVVPLKDRITIDKELNNIIEIDPDYFYNTYGIKMPKGGAKLKPTPPQAPPPAAQPQKKKPKLSARLTAYYNHACSYCAPITSGDGFGVRLSSDKEVERIAKLIYDGKLTPGSLDKKTLKKTASKLLAAINKGYLRKPDGASFTVKDEELLAFMRENIFVFSGFKTEKMLRQASELLLDKTGSIVPFSDFKKSVLELDKTYNVTYLSAEYNHAVGSAQMASKWVGFQELKDDFPNLKYQTAGDERVRDAHAVLNGLIIPMDDPMVDNIMPVKDWGCRCDMDATDEEPNNSSYSIDTSKLGPFKGNVGKTGIVFPSNHPYYETSQANAKRITAQAKKIMNE